MFLDMSAAKLHRKLHRIGAVLIFLPSAVVFLSGLLLQLKKEVSWIQPPTAAGSGAELALSFDEVLAAAVSAQEAGITGWEDVDRLDVRPSKGVIKVRGNNRWEVQVDASSGEVLQVAYRRSDLIESLHDGSWFHERVKLWVFLPSGIVLVMLWVTGVYLWGLPHGVRRRKRGKMAA